ncbi:hypothetical protein Goklo_001921 [Gossypium klotzschianum]|uniref:Uncharacterized protein n=1 Tax=Gossypium klotzschianum TaxID=34286 RepID=A0A7J8W242_9ROSI|nr:hypothetical protein [Gossypium klotzschianum]
MGVDSMAALRRNVPLDLRIYDVEMEVLQYSVSAMAICI